MSDDDRIAGVISREHIGAAICEDAFDLLRRVEAGEGVVGLITKAGALEILDTMANVQSDLLGRFDPGAVGKTDLFTWTKSLMADRDRYHANATDHERTIRTLKEALDAERAWNSLHPPPDLAARRRCRAGHNYVTNKAEPGRCWCGEAAALEVAT